LVVVAAGNTGGAPTRPADCHAVVSVTAVRSDGAKADYASLGSNVALAAPGGSGYLGNDNGLLTTLDAGRQGPISPSYGDLTGTSFAAPLAAGVAGLMLSAQPALDVDQLDRLLRQAVRPHTQQPLLSSCQLGLFSQGVCNCNTTSCGSGLLDADLAIQLAAATTATPTPASPTPVTPTPSSGGGGSTSIGWGGLLWLWVLAFAQFSRRKIATAWRP
jgi:serine protease